MVYATYTQTATKLAKDKDKLIYAVTPVNQYESDNVDNVINEFVKALNEMLGNGKDRLVIQVSFKTTESGDKVICAEFVPRDETAILAKVTY